MVDDDITAPVLLISIDSLRADYCSPQTLPQSWEYFERDFLQFENAIANGVATMLSFPGILSGRVVTDGGGINPHVGTIADDFDSYTWAYTNNPWLTCAYNYNQGFDYFTSRENIGNNGKSVSRKIKSQLGRSDIVRQVYNITKNKFQLLFNKNKNENLISYGHKPADFVLEKLLNNIQGPGLYWAHLMDPHWPYLPEKTLKENIANISVGRVREANNRFKNLSPTSGDLEILTKLYSEQIQFVDHHLHMFLNRLKQGGIYEDSMIIFVSDHGDLFGEDGYYYHNRKQVIPLDGVVRIPLFIKLPGGRHGGETRQYLVDHTQIRPTIDQQFDVSSTQNNGLLAQSMDPIMSFSDNHVRATDENGYAISSGDDLIKTTGSPDRKTIQAALDTSPPSVPYTHNPDWSASDREAIEDQLEALGYK